MNETDKLGKGWSKVKSYLKTGKQKTPVNCGAYCIMQAIYAVTGAEIDELEITKTMYTNSLMTNEGCRISDIKKAVKLISNNKLKIEWYNFSAIRFEGLIKILNDPDTTFITNFLSLEKHNHYAMIVAIQTKGKSIVQLNTAVNNIEEYITKKEYEKWCSMMPGPSIGVVKVINNV